MSIPIHILPLALAVAGAAGLRAFLPLFYLCLALHAGLVHAQQLNPHVLEYLQAAGSTTTLWTLGALALTEMVAEMIPAVAARLDIAMLLLRVVSAMVCTFAVTPLRSLPDAISVGFVAGFIGAIAIVNLYVRVAADEGDRLPTYVSFASSLLIDGLCLAVVALALQMPYIGLAVLYAGTWSATLLVHRWSRTVQKQVQVSLMAPPPEMPEEFLRRRRGAVYP